jgi:hypothetical protein
MGMLVDADPDEVFQPTESEEDDAIAEAIDLISELDDIDGGDKSGNNNDTSKPTIWHVRDGSGSWSDSRKIVALLNQNSVDWKLSKDRMTKIIQSFSSAGRTSGTAAYGAVEELGDVVQSVCLNSIASFCFEDATVQGGLRFWLGKVLRMVHRPKAGSKKLLTSRIALKDIPADKTKKDVEEEIDSIFKAWRQISSVLLHEIADYSEIVYFTKEIEERLFYIDSKVGKKFTSIFKHKVTHYFPEILDKDRMEELSLKYWNII